MADNGKSKGDRFPLLIYQRWAKMLRLPSLLIVVASGAAWWFASDVPLLADHDWVPIIIGIVSAAIFFYSLLARQAAYMQCYPNYVKLRTPFFSVLVSYRRILRVRPVEFHSQFPPTDMNRSQRRLLQPFFGRTVILMELNSYPISERRLRVWLPWFMFATEAVGFVLVVKNWMALSRQISTYSDHWVTRRQERQRPRIGFLR
jgi:hypothetical protein